MHEILPQNRKVANEMKGRFMADSSLDDFKKALTAAINEDPDDELREYVMSVPGKVEETVKEFVPKVPTDKEAARGIGPTGRTEASIEVKSRKSEYKQLNTRRIKIGEVYSDDDHERVGAIEYGRKEGAKQGETQGAFMFARAAAAWNDDGDG